jgi:PhzF family phenazine biosynthesis protein
MVSTVWMTVFADRPGGGNPCPVVFDFDGPPERMQAMAGEFGVETVFAFPGPAGSGGVGDYDAELRYFVPRHEMEMCVHATIAAGILLAESGRCSSNPARIKTALGILDVEWDVPASRAVVDQFPPIFGEPVAGVTRTSVLQALGIGERDVADDVGPIRSVSTARAKVMVPLAEESTLDGLRPDFERLWAVCDELDVTGFYPFVAAPRTGGADAAARQFPRRSGYDEDPATGVAACALGAYLSAQSEHGGTGGWRSWQIAQGRAMRRPSIITAQALLNDVGQIDQTRVGGDARRLRAEESRSF